MPGSAGNVTLTIENNATAIETFNVSVDSAGLSNLWNISASEDTVENVFPTWSKNTTIIVRLAEGAVPADSGSFDIHVTEPDQNFTSVITIYVSVAPSYLPILNLASMGGPLVSMDSGTNTTFTIDVENLGSVEDTLLLDVEYEPDLAAWWANYTNGSSNNSGNNTGNNTGGNGSGNNTGGNNTGGNGTGGNGSGSGGNNTTIISNVLMFGNSYTSFNSLHSIVEALGISNADALTGGGKTLAGHWSDVNSSHVSNTTLRNANIDWDYVILQDQSQIPGFNRTNADWIASKDAAVNLADVIGDEGGESILMMTWGRRNGDAMNPTLYSNFSVMQDRLESGYMDYHSNITNAGHTVWMAPVGLAFAHIHDNVVAAGFNASLTGNTFYDLYNADGSHPSLAGSYLAACVLYATMTGETPVGSNDSVSLNATLKLELQQAAAATVFNETSHLTYPWEVTGTSTTSMMMSSPRGLGGGIPAGWNVQWVDDEFANMAAGSSESASLHISVPSNAAPDYYGFRLFSASTGGNTSTSTMLVVHVDEEHNLSLAFLEQNELFIPGQSMNTSVQITNSGNAVVDYDWTLSVLNGPCNAALVTATTPSVAPDDVRDVGLQISVHSEATKTDTCSLQMNGIGTSASEQHSIAPFDFTVDVDERISFSLVSPLGDLDLTPGMPISYEMRVQNNGSETVTFYLDVNSTNGLSTTLESSSGVTVAAGEAGVWSLSTDADAGESGLMSQSFSVSYGGVTVEDSVDIEILGVHSATLSGPLDGRILVRPGETVLTSFNLENTGTSNLSLVAGLLGLPAQAEATLSHTSVELAVGESVTVDITLTIATSSEAGTHALTFAYGSSDLSVELQLSLQIQDRISVLVSSTGSRIVAGPSSSTVYSFDVTNLGTASDTLHLSLSENGASDWFEFELSSTSLQLGPGQSSTVTLSVRETSQGVASSGIEVALHAHSSSDESITSHINLTVESLVAGAEILVLSDDDSAEPSGEIYGTVVVTNTGTGSDQLLLSTVGLDCGVSTVLSLEAGESSSALPWSCLLPSDAVAGLSELKFRVTSSSRTSFSATSSEIYTVEPVWGSSGVLEVSFAQSSLTIPSSGGSTVMVSVTNLANAQVTGLLSLEGIGDGLLATEWLRYSDNTSSNEFTLTPGSTVEYSLTLMSLVSTSESAVLNIRASYQIGDTASSDLSSELDVEIEGPEMPPNGVRLPLGMELSQSDSLNALFGGWGVAILLLGVLYLTRNKKQNTLLEEEEVVEEEVEDEKETPLGFNECRMEDGKVTCPSCEARLGVPRGSEAPFRFTCPKCSTMIRVVE